VSQLNQGELHFVEPGLDKLLSENVGENIFFNNLIGDEIADSDIVFICVGTPSGYNGEVDLFQLESVLAQLSEYSDQLTDTAIVLRSTVPPGTTESNLLKYFRKEQVFFVPEFLREGSAVSDFYDSNCIIGSFDKESAYVEKLSLLPNFKEKQLVEIKTAEFIKYVNNSFHALKVAFGNEVGSLAKRLCVDNNELFNVFFSDTNLNISKAYLRPGFSFGGSCLVKDLMAINNMFISNKVHNKMLDSVLDSNKDHTYRVLELILNIKPAKICFVGASFKSNTDDLRHSPILTLIGLLLERPSYLKLEEIAVLERQIVINKLQNRYKKDINYLYDFSKDKDFDLIVWAATEPTEKFLSNLRKGQKIINLNYYKNEIFENLGFEVLSIV
jgi:GDP-mannose 6-dehydrogenase